VTLCINVLHNSSEVAKAQEVSRWGHNVQNANIPHCEFLNMGATISVYLANFVNCTTTVHRT